MSLGVDQSKVKVGRLRPSPKNYVNFGINICRFPVCDRSCCGCATSSFSYHHLFAYMSYLCNRFTFICVLLTVICPVVLTV